MPSSERDSNRKARVGNLVESELAEVLADGEAEVDELQEASLEEVRDYVREGNAKVQDELTQRNSDDECESPLIEDCVEQAAVHLKTELSR